MGYRLGKYLHFECLENLILILVHIDYSKGDNGYCYIPYEYMTNKKLCYDLWTVRQIACDNFSNANWDQEDLIDYRDMTASPVPSDENGDDDQLIEVVCEDDNEASENVLDDGDPVTEDFPENDDDGDEQ